MYFLLSLINYIGSIQTLDKKYERCLVLPDTLTDEECRPAQWARKSDNSWPMCNEPGPATTVGPNNTETTPEWGRLIQRGFKDPQGANMNGPPMNRQMIITGKAKFSTTTPTSGGTLASTTPASG